MERDGSRYATASEAAEALQRLGKASQIKELSSLLAWLTSFFEPALSLVQSAVAPVQRPKPASVTKLAQTYGPLSVRLVKAALTALADAQQADQQLLLGQLAGLGIDVLERIRSTLQGRYYEVELQRYTLVRQLASKGHFTLASQQGWLVYHSVCHHWVDRCSNSATDQKSQRKLAAPDTVKDSKSSAPIVVGTVLSLLLCCTNAPASSAANELQQLLPALEGVLPWFRYPVA